jgi:hypothetical protein
LKNWAAHEQACHRTSNTLIVAAMFEVSWYRSLSAMTFKLDNVKPGDVDLLHTCLDGLAYGSAIAIALGLQTERQAFSFQLAQLTFIERHRGNARASSNMKIRLVEGEHLKQDWFRPFSLMSEKVKCRTLYCSSSHPFSDALMLIAASLILEGEANHFLSSAITIL